MSYLERLSDEQAYWLRAGASRFVAQFENEFTESEREQAVENWADLMAGALIFECALSEQPVGK